MSSLSSEFHPEMQLWRVRNAASHLAREVEAWRDICQRGVPNGEASIALQEVLWTLRKLADELDQIAERNRSLPSGDQAARRPFAVIDDLPHDEPGVFFVACESCHCRYAVVDEGLLEDSRPAVCPACQRMTPARFWRWRNEPSPDRPQREMRGTIVRVELATEDQMKLVVDTPAEGALTVHVREASEHERLLPLASALPGLTLVASGHRWGEREFNLRKLVELYTNG